MNDDALSAPAFRLFEQEKKPLFAERARLDDRGKANRVRWKLRDRGGQAVEAGDETAIPAFDGHGGIRLRVTGIDPAQRFSYLRGQFTLQPEECEDTVRLVLELALENAPGVQVILGLYDDADLSRELASSKIELPTRAGTRPIELSVNFRELAVRHAPVHAFVQVCLTTGAGALVRVGGVSLRQTAGGEGFRRLRIRYDAFGDETKASSRLRVWKFVELLRSAGHEVVTGKGEVDVDLHVCQKVRPFATLHAVRTARPDAVVVYDLDDNFLLPEDGVLGDTLAFIAHADVVTCGSEYLARLMRRWHPSVHVLENPIDIVAGAPCRRGRGALDRIGWFGAPEGLGELARAKIASRVLTVTRGGDIEFDLASIDQRLCEFDLLLFPVEENDWNLAKNANRMIKALGLGVPVLASATPEHVRVARLLGVPAGCLVHSIDEWDDAIARVARNYAEIERATAVACARARTLYSTQAVLASLFDHLVATTRLGGIQAGISRVAAPGLSAISVLVVDAAEGGTLEATLAGTAIDWSAFRSVDVFSTRAVPAGALIGDAATVASVQCDFLAVFERADAFLAECEAEYVLVIPSGVALGRGMATVLETLVAEGVEALALFTRSMFASATLVGRLGAQPVRDVLTNIACLGPLLVRTRWIRSQDLHWRRSFDLWTWAVTVKALASDTPVTVVELPLAFEAVPRPEINVSDRYARWLQAHHPAVAAELPDLANQWRRLLADIVTDAARHASADLPSAFADIYTQWMLSQRELALAREQLAAERKQSAGGPAA